MTIHIQKGRWELDSHADTCVVGATWKVMEYTGVVSDVYPYSDSNKPLKQVPVKEAVTAYNHPPGETSISELCFDAFNLHSEHGFADTIGIGWCYLIHEHLVPQ